MKRFAVQDYMKERAALLEQGLRDFMPRQVPSALREAMEYSLFSGGKRLRPILVLATIESLGEDYRLGLPAACAVEMIHTYSLIHDDLPAMDDDDLRRGKPTNHKVFGEGMAILAGDALLTHAFYVIARHTSPLVPRERVVQLIAELAEFAGPSGMVGGQAADLLGEKKELTLAEIRYIHEHKTADMLRYCVRAGALLAGADGEQLARLTSYAGNLGLAFQIQDDILDVIGDEKKTGKAVGSDQNRHKATYPALLGVERSKREVERLIGLARQDLAEARLRDGTILEEIARFVMEREH
ncbi:(2E,6E)-farnesyl diphosphate synthase [Bacillaceae bacterium]